jgi:hypothetical protein
VGSSPTASKLVIFRTQSNYFRLVKGIVKKIAIFENQNQFPEEGIRSEFEHMTVHGRSQSLPARLSTGNFSDAPLRTWPLRSAVSQQAAWRAIVANLAQVANLEINQEAQARGGAML